MRESAMSEEVDNRPRWGHFPVPAVGDRYRDKYREHDTFEVRGIVDGQLVIRSWWKRKQRWNYTCEPVGWWPHPEMFEKARRR
jgi:hypothetical protein